ncbi:signal peptidase II [Propioniciclava sp.]|uniref:signal peptidase II n=1 Tax=Propioniciclava sp. TaxID=2038686 RepID=UPI00261507CB|nr:signal peptidase II [Propioniciclava sp.]
MQAAGGAAIGAPHAPVARRLIWTTALTIAAVGYALDQVTKYLAITYLDPADPPVLLGGLLTLQLIFNPGAAFSMGEGFTVGLTVIAAAALVFVLAWLLPRTRHRGWSVALGLLLAGILGNLTDRLVRPPGFAHGHVVDFLQLPYFAIFNVADMCITFAAVAIIWLVAVAGVEPSGRRADKAERAASE